LFGGDDGRTALEALLFESTLTAVERFTDDPCAAGVASRPIEVLKSASWFVDCFTAEA